MLACVCLRGVCSGAGGSSVVCVCEKRVSVSVLEHSFMCFLGDNIYEGETRGSMASWGPQSAWLGLCQAIWGAPVLYGARVKNGNANK